MNTEFSIVLVYWNLYRKVNKNFLSQYPSPIPPKMGKNSSMWGIITQSVRKDSPTQQITEIEHFDK